MWRRDRCGNDYTLRWDGKLYQIERQAVVTGLRGAKVRVEQRLDGSLAVRYGERYLPVEECMRAEKAKASPSRRSRPRRTRGRRGSDWNKNFDLKKAPKIWQAAQASGSAEESHLMTSSPGGVAGRQSSPFTGKCSARPAGKPGVCFVKENLRRSLPHHSIPAASKNIRGPRYAFFKAWRNLSVRCGLKTKPNPGPGPTASRRSAPAQVKERAGRTTPFSSSAMSSDRLFLDRVGRHQSPSPLHRHAQITCTSQKPRRKATFLLCQEGDISTLP